MATAATATRPPSRFLETAALSALRHLRFAPRGRIEGTYSGRHLSRQRGGASEFVDYREYAAGEDLRRLDWKVLARTGRPYVRLYQDETDLSCTLILDASTSMTFAGRRQREADSKLTYVQYLSTAISQVIRDQRDRVGLAICSDGLQAFHPPGATGTHVSNLQQAIADLVPAPTTNLSTPLRDLYTRLTRRGVMMVMSDFLVDDLDSIFSSLRLFKHNRWEIIVLHIVHPEEERLPEGLAYRFEGLENDGAADCSPEDVRRAYEQAFEAHAASVRTAAMAAGCDYRRVSTAVPYLQTLGPFLIEASG
jgi:uncharacterized protein (DUF58 family)